MRDFIEHIIKYGDCNNIGIIVKDSENYLKLCNCFYDFLKEQKSLDSYEIQKFQQRGNASFLIANDHNRISIFDNSCFSSNSFRGKKFDLLFVDESISKEYVKETLKPCLSLSTIISCIYEFYFQIQANNIYIRSSLETCNPAYLVKIEEHGAKCNYRIYENKKEAENFCNYIKEHCSPELEISIEILPYFYSKNKNNEKVWNILEEAR